MKLRGQLMLVTSLVVVLPLLGLQFVAQVEKLLRQGQEQALIDSAGALATIMPRQPAGGLDAEPLYVHTARQPLLLDGYGDDWVAWLDVTERLGPDGRQRQSSVAAVSDVSYAGDPPPSDDHAPASLALAQSPAGLHLLLRVIDADTRFAGPDGSAGDHVELRFAGPRGESRLRIVPTAPGRFTRAAEPGGWPIVHGVWQTLARGWNLELRIPLRNRPDEIGISVFDVDAGEARVSEYSIAGRVPLVAADAALSAELEALVPGGMRAWLVTSRGYVLARADRAFSGAAGREGAERDRSPSIWQTLLFERLAGDALSRLPPTGPFTARLTGPDLDAARAGEISPLWMIERDTERPGARVRVAMALDDGPGQKPMLVLERDADAMLLLASDAVLRLAGVSLVVFVTAAAVLLVFAWRLSSRIRRLQRSTEAAVARDGKVVAAPDRVRGSDEIAALSSSMSSLLDRLRVHQQYLGTLADRLSHELRTPLTMIGSSLDNLADQIGSGEGFDHDQAMLYLERAGQGNRRLNRIFGAMTQAARLEEALIDEPFELFDLAALAADYCAARRDACLDHELKFGGLQQPVRIHGSPDLVAQLLDKLVDNALDFAPGGSTIVVRVRQGGDRASLEVENEGAAIDPATAAELFEPMVSLQRGANRRSAGSEPHLGLGLFIVRLIAQRHGGRAFAHPTPAGSRFCAEFPDRLDRAARG